MTLGQVFGDREVAQLYRHRAPYPDEVFTILSRLLREPRTVLDAGAGTGALTFGMLPFASRIDAIDPSEAMIEAGRRSPLGADPRIRWIVGRAENTTLAPPYGLITCGASLHWMDLAVVLPRFRDALAPDAVMAIVDTEIVHGAYRADILEVIKEYSELEHHRETTDLVEELVATGRLELVAQERTEPVAFEQSVDEYLAMLHSTSTLARARLGRQSDAFDARIRAVLAAHGIDRMRYGVVGLVAWGRPT